MGSSCYSWDKATCSAGTSSPTFAIENKNYENTGKFSYYTQNWCNGAKLVSAPKSPEAQLFKARDIMTSNDKNSLKTCKADSECSNGEMCIHWIHDENDEFMCASKQNCYAFGRYPSKGGETKNDYFTMTCSASGTWKDKSMGKTFHKIV